MRIIIDTSNINVFPGKSLGDLLEDIYENSVEKQERIDGLIDQLADLIEKPEHANIIVPIIKEYQEIAVKNDKQLIEIAKITQRLESAYVRSSDNDEANSAGQLTNAEKNQIRNIVGDIREEKEEELKELEKKKKEAVDKVENDN